jgi:hypothetical protein
MPTPHPSSRRKDASAKAIGDVPAEESWVKALVEAIGTMRYGTVQISVHDWKVSQIERIDRVRLEVSPKEGNRNSPPA